MYDSGFSHILKSRRVPRLGRSVASVCAAGSGSARAAGAGDAGSPCELEIILRGRVGTLLGTLLEALICLDIVEFEKFFDLEM